MTKFGGITAWSWGLIGGIALALIGITAAHQSGHDGQRGSAAAIGLVIAAVCALGYWLNALVEIATTPISAWQRIDRSRGSYLVLVLLLGILGAWLYSTGIRKQLLVRRTA